MSMYGWERYQSIEKDFIKAREYVDFDITDAYSDFFSKSVILLGAEIEGCFKIICSNLGDKHAGNISDYKRDIFENYPGIVHLHSRLNGTTKHYLPFQGWNEGKLFWWSVYTDVKHSLVDHTATSNMALHMLAAYQLLLFIIHMQMAIKAGSIGSVETYLLTESPRLFVPDIGLSQGFVSSDSMFHQLMPVNELESRLKSEEPDFKIVSENERLVSNQDDKNHKVDDKFIS